MRVVSLLISADSILSLKLTTIDLDGGCNISVPAKTKLQINKLKNIILSIIPDFAAPSFDGTKLNAKPKSLSNVRLFKLLYFT